MNPNTSLKKGFEHEVESWNSLYGSGSPTGRRARYAIFQKHAAKRTRNRMALCLKLLNPRPSMKILDIGCGSGAFSNEIVSRGADWVGLDLSFKMLSFGRHPTGAHSRADEKMAWVNGSAKSLPFRDKVFDAAICVGMVNFYPQEQLPVFLEEMTRIIKPGGNIVLTSLRLDLLTWIRSRLYPWIPLPFSSPGPLYPHHYRAVLRLIDPTSFECTDMVQVKKYLGMPHYTLFNLLKT